MGKKLSRKGQVNPRLGTIEKQADLLLLFLPSDFSQLDREALAKARSKAKAIKGVSGIPKRSKKKVKA